MSLGHRPRLLSCGHRVLRSPATVPAQVTSLSPDRTPCYGRRYSFGPCRPSAYCRCAFCMSARRRGGSPPWLRGSRRQTHLGKAQRLIGSISRLCRPSRGMKGNEKRFSEVRLAKRHSEVQLGQVKEEAWEKGDSGISTTQFLSPATRTPGLNVLLKPSGSRWLLKSHPCYRGGSVPCDFAPRPAQQKRGQRHIHDTR